MSNGGNRWGLEIGSTASRQFGDHGEKKSRYDLEVTPQDVAKAIDNRFADYVVPAAQDHILTYLGHIDPRLVIMFGRNLNRKLEVAEVELLGGPDGNEERVCELTLEIAMQELGVSSFEELPPNRQRVCMFKPAWGLNFTDNGAVVHILNVILNSTPSVDLTKAILFVKIGQVEVFGHQVKVIDKDGDVANETLVAGAPWHITKDGKVFAGHGQLGNLEKELRTMKVQYRMEAFTVSPTSIFEKLTAAQQAAKQEVFAKRTNLTRSFAARLAGRPEDVADAARI